MTFSITVDMGTKVYRMQVEQIYIGESIEKFRVTGGQRSIVLQSNRPMVLESKTKKPIEWKLVEGEINPTNTKNAALALLRIMHEIEKRLKPEEVNPKEYLRATKK